MGNVFSCIGVAKDKRRKAGRKGRKQRKWNLRQFICREDLAVSLQHEGTTDHVNEEKGVMEEEEWKLCDVDEEEIEALREETPKLEMPDKVKIPVTPGDEEYADDEQPIRAEIFEKIQKPPSQSPSPVDLSNICTYHTRQGIDETVAATVDIAAGTDNAQHTDADLTALAFAGDIPIVKDDDNHPDMPDSPVTRGTDSPVFTCADDCDIYQSEDTVPEPEPVTKVYHYNAEDWEDFYKALYQEYKEQTGDDSNISSPMSDASEDASTPRTSTTPTPDNDDNQTKHFIGKLLSIVLHRVHEAVTIKEIVREAEDIESVSSEEFENDRWTPPLVEGEIYSGPGVLKKKANDDTNDNQKRNITWNPDVKSPAREYNIHDALSDAFIREWSKLRAKRKREQSQEDGLDRLSCIQVNNTRNGLITQGCRIPVAIKRNATQMSVPRPTNSSECRTISPGCRIPVPIKETMQETPNILVIKPSKIPLPLKTNTIQLAKLRVAKYSSILWMMTKVSRIPVAMKKKAPPVPEARVASGGDLASTEMCDSEQFQRTELFRQRYRKRREGNGVWKKGLAPFQVRVIEQAGTTEHKEIQRPHSRTRTLTAKAKVSCWR